MFDRIIEKIREKSPLVHCITNYVTVNDCANILLACGASPIMADDRLEVEEITSISNALVINIGTLNERTVDSMLAAGRKANELNHPVILDPVGAGASRLRTDTVKRLLSEVKFSVIRGNISEIKAVYNGSGNTKGVDADISDCVNEDNLSEVIQFAKSLSMRTGAVIVITGSTDIIADKDKANIVRNGHPMMSKISGTGCMLTSVIGAFCAANPADIMEASTAATCAMGICGELAYKRVVKDESGTSSLKVHLIDYMSKLDLKLLDEWARVKVR